MEAFNIYNNIFCQAELLKLFEQIFSFINGENAHNSLINRIGLTDVDNTIDVLEVMYIIYIYFMYLGRLLQSDDYKFILYITHYIIYIM